MNCCSMNGQGVAGFWVEGSSGLNEKKKCRKEVNEGRKKGEKRREKERWGAGRLGYMEGGAGCRVKDQKYLTRICDVRMTQQRT